jgi:hypothetical protein
VEGRGGWEEGRREGGKKGRRGGEKLVALQGSHSGQQCGSCGGTHWSAE